MMWPSVSCPKCRVLRFSIFSVIQCYGEWATHVDTVQFRTIIPWKYIRNLELEYNSILPSQKKKKKGVEFYS